MLNPPEAMVSDEVDLIYFLLYHRFLHIQKWQYKFSKEQHKPNYYIDPLDPNRESAQIPLLLKAEGAHQINADLSNMPQIIQPFEDLYKNRF